MSCCVWLDSQSRLETCGMPSRLHFHSTMEVQRPNSTMGREGGSVCSSIPCQHGFVERCVYICPGGDTLGQAFSSIMQHIAWLGSSPLESSLWNWEV